MSDFRARSESLWTQIAWSEGHHAIWTGMQSKSSLSIILSKSFLFNQPLNYLSASPTPIGIFYDVLPFHLLLSPNNDKLIFVACGAAVAVSVIYFSPELLSTNSGTWQFPLWRRLINPLDSGRRSLTPSKSDESYKLHDSDLRKLENGRYVLAC